MKINREELERSKEESVLELFWQGIKADATKKKYTRTLQMILCDVFEDVLVGGFEKRTDEFVRLAKEEPEWTKDLLLNLSKKLKKRTEFPKDHSEYLNPSSVDSYFKPIKKLFDMNDVTISWKRIYSTFPEMDNISVGRGWTRQEIQKMLNHANGALDRAIVLVAASSGIRSGGFDLNWDDVIPIYKVDDQLKIEITESEEKNSTVACAMLRIYKGTSYQYPAFITAEAYSALLDYKQDWVRDVGHEPKPDESIFKKEGPWPRKSSSAAIKKRVERMVERAVLRLPLQKGQRRHEIPIMNGFRRFWNKTCKEALSRDSPLASLIKKEYMMGHAGLVRLDRNYFKTHTLELAEEYLEAAPDLTISDESRLKQDNIKLRKEKDQYQNSSVIKRLEKRIDEIENGPEARNKKFFETMYKTRNNPLYQAVALMYKILFEMSSPEYKKQKVWKKIQDKIKKGLEVDFSPFGEPMEFSIENIKSSFSKN